MALVELPVTPQQMVDLGAAIRKGEARASGHDSTLEAELSKLPVVDVLTVKRTAELAISAAEDQVNEIRRDAGRVIAACTNALNGNHR